MGRAIGRAAGRDRSFAGAEDELDEEEDAATVCEGAGRAAATTVEGPAGGAGVAVTGGAGSCTTGPETAAGTAAYGVDGMRR